MSGGSSRRYPPELRERAVRMVAEISDQHDSEWAAISEVAQGVHSSQLTPGLISVRGRCGRRCCRCAD
jgi:transposase-like protein